MPGTRIVIDVEWQFISGKFASRESLVEAIMGELNGTDPGAVQAEEGEYEIVSWDISEDEVIAPLSKKKLIEKLTPACAVLGITDKHKIEQFVDLYRSSGGVLG